jgi:hypothetical protein
MRKLTDSNSHKWVSEIKGNNNGRLFQGIEMFSIKCIEERGVQEHHPVKFAMFVIMKDCLQGLMAAVLKSERKDLAGDLAASYYKFHGESGVGKSKEDLLKVWWRVNYLGVS